MAEVEGDSENSPSEAEPGDQRQRISMTIPVPFTVIACDA